MTIPPHRALRAASYLLKIDHGAMQEGCRSDLPDMMNGLKNVLDDYEKHLQKHYRVLFNPETIEVVTEQKLQLLTDIVNSLASLLLPEARVQLESFIINLKLPDPIPPYPILGST
jgi:hypothetical protein